MQEFGTTFSIRYDPHLVVEAIFLATKDRPNERIFHKGRTRLYDIADPAARDRAFQEYHLSWFVRLRLDAPIKRAFAEQPSIRQAVRGCVIGWTPVRKDEGAELFVGPLAEGLSERERRSVGVLLRSESLLDADSLLGFLRRELLHIADILDPDFAYEPTLPQAEGGPAHDSLLRDRYRALWNATIDGRLVRRGWAPASLRERCLHDFARVFPLVGSRLSETFAHFFDTEPHTHAELVAFACELDRHPLRPSQGSRCPLCRFPTYTFASDPERLPAQVIAGIVEDFPAWLPAQGLCLQCADLYRARALSVPHSMERDAQLSQELRSDQEVRR
jgi:hypothetical protein